MCSTQWTLENVIQSHDLFEKKMSSILKKIRSIQFVSKSASINSFTSNRLQKHSKMKSYLEIILLFTAISTTISDTLEIGARIFNGNPSQRNQFPYYVFLERILAPNFSKSCGATLISNEWVLTAAHCVMDGELILLHFGVHETRNLLESGREMQSIPKPNIFVHPGYSVEDVLNDIALIKLVKPIKFSASIQPVKMAFELFDPEEEVNVETVAIGNGFSTEGQDLADYVEWVVLKTSSRARCEEVFPFLMNEKTIICSENGHGSVTSGDSGGPLIRIDDNTLIGISCFNHMNSSLLNNENIGEVFPQAFTNVGYYIGWIRSITMLNFD